MAEIKVTSEWFKGTVEDMTLLQSVRDRDEDKTHVISVHTTPSQPGWSSEATVTESAQATTDKSTPNIGLINSSSGWRLFGRTSIAELGLTSILISVLLIVIILYASMTMKRIRTGRHRFLTDDKND